MEKYWLVLFKTNFRGQAVAISNQSVTASQFEKKIDFLHMLHSRLIELLLLSFWSPILKVFTFPKKKTKKMRQNT